MYVPSARQEQEGDGDGDDETDAHARGRSSELGPFPSFWSPSNFFWCMSSLENQVRSTLRGNGEERGISHLQQAPAAAREIFLKELHTIFGRFVALHENGEVRRQKNSDQDRKESNGLQRYHKTGVTREGRNHYHLRLFLHSSFLLDSSAWNGFFFFSFFFQVVCSEMPRKNQTHRPPSFCKSQPWRRSMVEYSLSPSARDGVTKTNLVLTNSSPTIPLRLDRLRES